ncbi:MAG: SAM-dependent chlorinase/fluorinase [Planctomycetota bacterium]
MTLTTDFGEGSRYIAAMKGVILSINPDAQVVDLSHSIPPQDIATGARVLAETAPWFPAGTIHVVVVDPGVGSDRSIVCCEFETMSVVCPDNGLLTNLAEHENPRKIVAVEQPKYWMPVVSSTFHGRDIMAPVAAHLSLGTSPDLLGTPRQQVTMLPARQAVRTTSSTDTSSKDGADTSKESSVGQQIEGEVVEVDSFGNLITNITDEMLSDCPRDASVTIRCDEHETMGIYRTYSEQPPMTLVALIGSGGALELAIVDDSAKLMLGVGTGAPVVVAW